MMMEVRNGKGSLTRLIAGIVLIVASLLTVFHDVRWCVVSLAVGLTHVISATTGFCVMEMFLSKVFGFEIKGKD